MLRWQNSDEQVMNYGSNHWAFFLAAFLFAVDALASNKESPLCVAQVVSTAIQSEKTRSRFFDPELRLRPEGPPEAGNPAYEEFVADVWEGMRGMAAKAIKTSGYRGPEDAEDLAQWGFEMLPYHWNYLATHFDPKVGTTVGYMIMNNIKRQMVQKWIKPRAGLHGNAVNEAGQLIALATDRFNALGNHGLPPTDVLLQGFLDLLRARQELAARRRLKVRYRGRATFEAQEVREEVMSDIAGSLRAQVGREPTDKEVLDRFNTPLFDGRPVTAEKIEEWRRLNAPQEFSSDAGLDDAPFYPVTPDPKAPKKTETTELLLGKSENAEQLTFKELLLILCPQDTAKCWKQFSEGEQQILYLMEARRATVEETADLLGLTRSWVLDVRRKALNKAQETALRNLGETPRDLAAGLSETDLWVKDHERLNREINYIQHQKTIQNLPNMSTAQNEWLNAYLKEIAKNGMALDLFRSKLEGKFPGRQGKKNALFGGDGLGGLFQSPSEFWLAMKRQGKEQGVELRLLDLDMKHFGGDASASMRLALRQELFDHIRTWESLPGNRGKVAGRENYGMGRGQIPVSHRRAMGSHGEDLVFSSQSDYWLFYKQYRTEEGRPILLLNINIQQPSPALIAERRREIIALALHWIRENPGVKLTKYSFGEREGQIPVNYQKVIRRNPFVLYQNSEEFMTDVREAARVQGVLISF